MTDSINRKLKRYIEQNHRWIIGTLIAVIIPLFIYSLQKRDAVIFESKTLYYANFNKIDKTDNLKDADCWVTSIGSNRRDAFRCSVENVIYDPCFEIPSNDSFVSCPGNPNDSAPITFKMISRPKFDEKIESFEPIPWYIILENKEGCRLLTGATEVIANRRLDYQCGEGRSLFLPLERVDKRLKIGCSNGDRIEACSILEAWY